MNKECVDEILQDLLDEYWENQEYLQEEYKKYIQEINDDKRDRYNNME